MTNTGDTPKTSASSYDAFNILSANKRSFGNPHYNVKIQNGKLRAQEGRAELPEIIEIEGGGNKIVFRKDADEGSYTASIPGSIRRQLSAPRRHFIPKLSPKLEKIEFGGRKTRKPAVEVKPAAAMAYMDTNDAAVAFQAVQAFQVMLSKSGYGKIEITDVQSGSIFLRFKAWLNGEDGQSATNIVKGTIGDYAMVGDQALKDILLNERRSKIEQVHAETFSTYMQHLNGVDNAAFACDGLLIIKLTNAQGQTTMMTQRISLEHQLILEKSPTLLMDPARLLENLGLESQMAIE